MTFYPCFNCSEDKPKYTVDENGFPVCVDCAIGKECLCGNEGFYVVANTHTGDPEQEQCEFCYTTPDSKFSIREGLSR